MAKIEYCIIGYGIFGEQIARQLKKFEKKVMIIDFDDGAIDKASHLYDVVIKCYANDINALIDCGIKNVKNVIVTTSNIENSIMICANLKQLEVENILARAKNFTHERVLKTMGITNVVYPEIDVANKIAIQLVYNQGADITAVNKDLCWIKTIVTNPNIQNKSIFDLQIKEKYYAIIISIQRKDSIIFPITKINQFKIGDIVTLVCNNNNIKKVINFFSQKK